MFYSMRFYKSIIIQNQKTGETKLSKKFYYRELQLIIDVIGFIIFFSHGRKLFVKKIIIVYNEVLQSPNEITF